MQTINYKKHLQSKTPFNSSSTMDTEDVILTQPSDHVEEETPENNHHVALVFSELLPQLPKRYFWETRELYLWNGYWYRPRHLEAALVLHSRFEPQPDDVLLTSSMKTGTTWLKALCSCIVTRDVTQGDLLESNHPAHFVKTLEVQVYTENTPPDLSLVKPPRLFHTHLPYSALPQSAIDSGCKIVYITRNPKDTLVSLWHFFNHLREDEGLTRYPFEKAYEGFCEGVTLFGPFFNHVLEYFHKSKEHPDRILFLKYEDLKKDPSGGVKRIAEFIGRSLPRDQEVEDVVWRCSLERLKNLEVNQNGVDPWVNMANSSFFRNGIVGDWKNYFTEEMAARLDAITREKLSCSGLVFESEIGSNSSSLK
ncbi:hypothetical protein MLD38_002511 [Melastoma candidum]|uniref:Uncharacterized protein n=1 Tax=Melastoma candidum TaxID=119954 RepID=A0ACB9RZK0_9MYRT|nr:hypothetical protein MLD38_002511 [Melastoma candidum]